MKTPLHGPHDHVEDQTPAELRESAYRRGYQQGLHQAIAFLKANGSLSGLEDYLREVSQWRDREGSYKSSRDRIDRPPVPKNG